MVDHDCVCLDTVLVKLILANWDDFDILVVIVDSLYTVEASSGG